MKINKTIIKRRYYDMRTGNVTVSPILQLGNFLMLSYLTISDTIPMWIFAPLFVVGIISVFTMVGNKFRKVQTSTDINMQYEKSTEAVKSMWLLSKRVNDIADELGMKHDPEFDQRLDYQKEIADNKI
jgi:hypothetical protein